MSVLKGPRILERAEILEKLTKAVDDLQDAVAFVTEEIPDSGELTIEALPRAGGWDIRRGNISQGYLRASDGWTQLLIDQLVRVTNEGMPL